MKIIMEQLQEVEQRLKHEKSRRMFEHYQTVRLYLLGKDHEGEDDYGTGQNSAPVGDWSGTITVVDTDTGLQSWPINIATPAFGGVTVNAGNLLVFGQSNQTGTLSAVSTDSGELVWTTETGGPIGSAPIIYQINGHSYVTVVTGGAIAMLGLYPYSGRAHVLTYQIN